MYYKFRYDMSFQNYVDKCESKGYHAGIILVYPSLGHSWQ